MGPPHKYTVALPEVPQDLGSLGQWVRDREFAHNGLKDDNQARILWADPDQPKRTPCSMVYLHGLTASPGEVDPQHRRLQQAFGCNLFVGRLPGHGLRSEAAMGGFTAQDWVDTAGEALAIGKALGDRVILIGSSLGASLSMILAAAFPSDVAAVVAWSPGVRAHDPAALEALCNADDILRDPRPRSEAQLRYWSESVHPDAYRSLAELFSEAMNAATFSRVRAPVFMGYFYKDEETYDRTASVPAMLGMFEALGTSKDLKQSRAYPDGTHVVASPWRSEAAEGVFADTCAFLREVVGLPLAPAMAGKLGSPS